MGRTGTAGPAERCRGRGSAQRRQCPRHARQRLAGGGSDQSDRIQTAVRAASPDLFRAVRADLASGRFIDGGHSARAERVAILGPMPRAAWALLASSGCPRSMSATSSIS